MLRHFEILLGLVRHGLEVFHPRQQEPDHLLVFPDDADVDGAHRVMLDPPHIVAVVDVGFLSPAVDLGDLVGRKFQRPGLTDTDRPRQGQRPYQSP